MFRTVQDFFFQSSSLIPDVSESTDSLECTVKEPHQKLNKLCTILATERDSRAVEKVDSLDVDSMLHRIGCLKMNASDVANQQQVREPGQIPAKACGDLQAMHTVAFPRPPGMA